MSLSYSLRTGCKVAVSTKKDAKMTRPKTIKIVILDYPGSFSTSSHGLKDFFLLANRVIKKNVFDPHILTISEFKNARTNDMDYFILPPNMDGTYYLNPDVTLIKKIQKVHNSKSVVCSICAGAFILASSGIADSKTITTHWALGKELKEKFPNLEVDTDKILIDDNQLITAGGMMSWMDLAFQIIKRTCNPSIVTQLSHLLIVNTSEREQKSYKQFLPDFNHPDEEIKKCQSYIAKNFANTISLAVLANLIHTTERTLLRRFTKATGLTPLDYVQSVRVQSACEKLERTNTPVESIAHQVGYENVGAFRKVFIQKIGLKPLDFRRMYAYQTES